MVILFDQFNLPDDVFQIIFSTDQQVIVAKYLVNVMKEKDKTLTKSEMSHFAKKLHNGTLIQTEEKGLVPNKKEVELSYNKRQFYDRILTPMKSMGLVEYDMYKKHYKLSEKFNHLMIKIGLMWVQELRKPARKLNTKD